MKAEQVPAEWVKAAWRGWESAQHDEASSDDIMAHALAAVAPFIAAQERERCAQVADREADTQRIVRGRQQEDWEYLQKQDAKTDVAENIAAAIRTLD